jgi:hypothetical protein
MTSPRRAFGGNRRLGAGRPRDGVQPALFRPLSQDLWLGSPTIPNESAPPWPTVLLGSATYWADVAGDGNTNATFSKPVGAQAGDYWVVFLEADGSAADITASTYTAPTGWVQAGTKLVSSVDGAGALCYYKLLDGSEGSTATFNSTSVNSGMIGVSFLVRNAGSVTATTELVNTASTPIVVGPSITTTENNSTIVWIGATDFGAFGTPTWREPTGYDALTTYVDTVGAWWSSIAVAWRAAPTPTTDTAKGSATMGATTGGGFGFKLAFAPYVAPVASDDFRVLFVCM